MKTITTNNRTLLFVEVPEDADGFIVGFTAMCWDLGKPTVGIAYFPVSHNTYRLIATTDTITEEQAAMFVGKGRVGYAHYGERVKHYNSPLISAMMANGGSVEIYYTTALESFESLLQHHSITGRHAIIEVV